MPNAIHVPVIPGRTPGQHRQPEHPEGYVGRHRAEETKRSLGKRLLGLFHRSHHTLANDTTRPIPQPRPEQAVQANDFKLAYRFGDTRDKKLERQSLNLNEHQPLLTREEVAEQLGTDKLGQLQAVIHLPMREPFVPDPEFFEKREISVFCFKQEVEGQPRYLFMSKNQVAQVRSMTQTGLPRWEDISGGILSLSAGEQETIGRLHWLPDVGKDGAQLLEHDKQLAHHYGAISREHTRLNVDEAGALHIQDISHEMHGTTISVAPLVSQALTASTGDFTTIG